jgi:3-dehydroquinate dehydratase/shikimate dehydrogenase
MTLLVVAIPVEHASEVPEALETAAAEVRAGARLVEWRVDALAEESDALQAIGRLVRESPAPCVVTIRCLAEGGAYRGSDMDRVSLLEAIGTADPGPRYLDVELATLQRSANLRQKVLLAVDHDRQVRDLKTGLVVSVHDFQGRPADLVRRLSDMWSDPACAVAKVAWRARSVRDCVEAFELLRQAPKPTTAICMGPFGLPSRVLAPKFGAFITYAKAEGEMGTAPGQLTVRQLRQLYRFDRIGTATRVFGVVGWPVEHSLSPRLHNAGFDATGFDGVHLPLPVPAAWEHFKATLATLLDFGPLDLRGLSVTIPHKEHLVRWIRERGGTLDVVSQRCGAANTLLVDPTGGVRGVNTDAPAAAGALAAGMGWDPAPSERLASGESPTQVPGGPDVRQAWGGLRVAVLGAGGAARAVAAGLSLCGARVVVFNRTHERAESIERDLHRRPLPGGGESHVVAGRPDTLACGCFHAFVQCTSLGMEGGPDAQGNPLPDEVPLDDTVTVMDTIYRPRRTPLVRMATSRGARVVDGTAMFVRQAELQFGLFTAQPAPPGLFRRVVDQAVDA